MSRRALAISVSGLALALVACGPTAPPTAAPAASRPAGAAGGGLNFVDAGPASGIDFVHVAGRGEQKWMPEIMGSGVALVDFNRDGAPDVLLVNSGTLGVEQRPASARSRLYLNDGRGRFTDVTDAWGLPSRGYGMGVAVGDFDNDGFPDLFLTHFDGQDLLLRNRGDGFEDVTAAAGIRSDGRWSTSAGFLDHDRDGHLDLFVVRYLDYPLEDVPRSFRNGMAIYPTPLQYLGVADRLWRNDGSGRFSDVSAEVGLDASVGKGLALAIGDLDLDGAQEVYVANDTDANQLWTGTSQSRWRDIAQLAGCAYDEHGREDGSMGADFSDFDDSGLPAIAVSNFQLEVTSIYRQHAPLVFNEVSDRVGVGRTSRQRLSFGIDFFDADNSGHEDLLVANGHIEDNIHLNSDSVTFAQPNSLYRNLGNGRFSDVSLEAGEALAAVQVSRGLATADLDGDGALDFVVNNNGDRAQIAFNRSPGIGNFVVLWLEGSRMNRSAIGARAVARIGGRSISREVMGAQSYLGMSDFRLHFGLGEAERIEELVVHWQGGESQRFEDVSHGGFYHLREGGELTPFIPGAAQLPP